MNSGFIVVISVLTAIFFGALIILILIVRKKLCKSFELFVDYYQPENHSDQNLVENMEVSCENTGVELGEVPTCDVNNEIFDNEIWTENVGCLMPHCIGILKIAHLLTDKIVKLTLIEPRELYHPETFSDLVPLAKRIGSRVDDVVRSMYPPLDPRLLEARCSALVLSVNHLVLLAKSTCFGSGSLDWVDQEMANMEDHLNVLREASTKYEENIACSQQGCSKTLEIVETAEDCVGTVEGNCAELKLHQQLCLETSSSV